MLVVEFLRGPEDGRRDTVEYSEAEPPVSLTIPQIPTLEQVFNMKPNSSWRLPAAFYERLSEPVEGAWLYVHCPERSYS